MADRGKLPEWDDCVMAVHDGVATSLQHFIFANEPCGPKASNAFRAGLINLIAEIRSATLDAAKSDSAP